MRCLFRDEPPFSASLASFCLTSPPLIQVDNGQEQHGEKAIMRGKGRKKRKGRHAIMCVRGRVTIGAPLKWAWRAERIISSPGIPLPPFAYIIIFTCTCIVKYLSHQRVSYNDCGGRLDLRWGAPWHSELLGWLSRTSGTRVYKFGRVTRASAGDSMMTGRPGAEGDPLVCSISGGVCGLGVMGPSLPTTNKLNRQST